MYVGTLPYLTHHKDFINDHGDDVGEEEKDGPWWTLGKQVGERKRGMSRDGIFVSISRGEEVATA